MASQDMSRICWGVVSSAYLEAFSENELKEAGRVLPWYLAEVPLFYLACSSATCTDT